MAKETPTNRLLPVRRSFREGGFGDNLKWLRDLTENKPESRDLTRTPLIFVCKLDLFERLPTEARQC